MYNQGCEISNIVPGTTKTYSDHSGKSYKQGKYTPKIGKLDVYGRI